MILNDKQDKRLVRTSNGSLRKKGERKKPPPRKKNDAEQKNR